MPDIIDNGDGSFAVEVIINDFDSKAEVALDQIDARLAVLEGTPSNAEILEALIETVRLQRKELKVLRKLLRAHTVS